MDRACMTRSVTGDMARRGEKIRLMVETISSWKTQSTSWLTKSIHACTQAIEVPKGGSSREHLQSATRSPQSTQSRCLLPFLSSRSATTVLTREKKLLTLNVVFCFLLWLTIIFSNRLHYQFYSPASTPVTATALPSLRRILEHERNQIDYW